MGTIVFGSQNEEFNNFFRSFETILFFLLGQIDPALDVIVNDVQSGLQWNRILYFYSYIGVCYFLILNMLLAIIVESYQKVKESFGDNVPPVWTDLADLATQSLNIAKYKKRNIHGDACLSHEQVLEHFDELVHTAHTKRDVESHLEREKDGSVIYFNDCLFNIKLFYSFPCYTFPSC